MNVEILEGPSLDCESFVRRFPHAKLSQMPGWGQMVQRVMGHQAMYLVARDGQALRGVLPLTHVKSRHFGNRLVSQAFASYGGPLFEDDAALEALLARAVELAKERSCSLELRMDAPINKGLVRRQDKIAMRLALQADPDAMWKSFKSDTKVRNHVRAAQKAGIEPIQGGIELLDEFYDIYTRRMRQLGTPCYCRALMAGILETFPNDSRLYVARLAGKAVAARLVMRVGEILESMWGVTLTEYNKMAPNHLLYWEVFKDYGPKGAKWFDFGPSTIGTGPHEFKKQWDAIGVDLYWEYWLPPGESLEVVSPSNPKYRRKIETWKRLPLWLTRWMGPKISRHLP
jgi:FemAB-related protein (PEP-CTERM system-associated)